MVKGGRRWGKNYIWEGFVVSVGEGEDFASRFIWDMYFNVRGEVGIREKWWLWSYAWQCCGRASIARSTNGLRKAIYKVQ